jgi:hypothetical protein
LQVDSAKSALSGYMFGTCTVTSPLSGGQPAYKEDALDKPAQIMTKVVIESGAIILWFCVMKRNFLNQKFGTSVAVQKYDDGK